MNSTAMMKIVLETVLFFALASDEVVQADEAVRRLEEIVRELRHLPREEKQEFLSFVETTASAEERLGHDRERVEFLQTLAENLSLTE
jgi:hypothetical protein